MRKPVIAIGTGFLVWTGLWLGSNALLGSFFAHWYSPEGKALSLSPLVVGLIDTILFSLLAGYLVGRLTGAIRSVIVLGVLQLAVGLVVTIFFFETAPLWYHGLFLLLLMPAHLAGGQLAKIR